MHDASVVRKRADLELRGVSEVGVIPHGDVPAARGHADRVGSEQATAESIMPAPRKARTGIAILVNDRQPAVSDIWPRTVQRGS
jgi:hypothetical protein